MRVRLDSTLSDDAGWTTPCFTSARTLVATSTGARLVNSSGDVLTNWADPIDALHWLDQSQRKRRWVGYLAYELGAWFEPTALPRPGDEVELFRFAEMPQALEPPHDGPPGGPRIPEAPPLPVPASNFSRSAYLEAVARCIDYIAAGDIFQVNLSQRLSLPFLAPAADLYAALLCQAPAAYGALIETDDGAIISNSPELFLRVTGDRKVVTRPIKGTRPLGQGMEQALRVSEKDAAELNMIVDLERNDLGRVCEIGTVRVTQPRTVETHPTVYHGVATIEGHLRSDVGLVELLAATFPGGSITGAPKIRAMQIIHELEPSPRGVYCGAIGYLDPDGSLQLNIAIRTVTLDRRVQVLQVPVGGGIVADSVPAEEYDETLVKARAVLAAAASVAHGALT